MLLLEVRQVKGDPGTPMQQPFEHPLGFLGVGSVALEPQSDVTDMHVGRYQREDFGESA